MPTQRNPWARMTRAIACILFVLGVAGPWAASAQNVTVEGVDTIAPIGSFPPALEVDPTRPDVAFLGSINSPGIVGVDTVRIAPALPLGPALAVPPFFLPPDLNGADPAPTSPLFINDVRVEAGTGLGWVNTQSFEAAIPFDTTTGQAVAVRFQGALRLSVPTRRSISGDYTTTSGRSMPSFQTNITEDVLRVGNRLLAVTGNFVRFSPPETNPGVVLIFEIADPAARPLVVVPASPPFFITSDPNPTALTPLPGGLVAVTNTGLIGIAANGTGEPVGPGSVDIIDPAAGRIVASIPLGAVNPGLKEFAVDPTGQVGVLGSSVRRELYAIDLRGLDALPPSPADPTRQRPSCNGASMPFAGGVRCLPERVIRGVDNPVAPPAAPGQSGADGLLTQVRFGASGDFVVATDREDGLLIFVAFDPRNLDRPHPFLPSRLGPGQSVQVTPIISAGGAERSPGPMVLRASPSGGLAGTDVAFATGLPSGSIRRLRLGGALPTPAGDFDADGIEDALDNCPTLANSGQADRGAIGTPGADGVGDACQCGDVSDDGRVDTADLTAVRRFLVSGRALLAPDKCPTGDALGAGEKSGCDLASVVRVRRALASLPPALQAPGRCIAAAF